MDNPDGPTAGAKPDPKPGPRAERDARLAKALRDNLRRRKALQKAPDTRPGTD